MNINMMMAKNMQYNCHYTREDTKSKLLTKRGGQTKNDDFKNWWSNFCSSPNLKKSIFRVN